MNQQMFFVKIVGMNALEKYTEIRLFEKKKFSLGYH